MTESGREGVPANPSNFSDSWGICRELSAVPGPGEQPDGQTTRSTGPHRGTERLQERGTRRSRRVLPSLDAWFVLHRERPPVSGGRPATRRAGSVRMILFLAPGKPGFTREAASSQPGGQGCAKASAVATSWVGGFRGSRPDRPSACVVGKSCQALPQRGPRRLSTVTEAPYWAPFSGELPNHQTFVTPRGGSAAGTANPTGMPTGPSTHPGPAPGPLHRQQGFPPSRRRQTPAFTPLPRQVKTPPWARSRSGRRPRGRSSRETAHLAGQPTVTRTVCQPVAPSGATGALRPVWVSPVTSVART